MTSHYTNQRWPKFLTHICFTRPQWVNYEHKQAFVFCVSAVIYPDSKFHGASMGPILGRQDPVRPMLAPWSLLSGKDVKHGPRIVNSMIFLQNHRPFSAYHFSLKMAMSSTGESIIGIYQILLYYNIITTKRKQLHFMNETQTRSQCHLESKLDMVFSSFFSYHEHLFSPIISLLTTFREI